ncbi:hypothetical protein HYPSUDRAFT_199019 [Hypholoma sublateritium FD-334 SS-4]|uniref:C3HC-type domain-containing protein n=1 Tax=Hypholoma sublateritium (strain FD-334 SS-4) TaxID=945553 RepID=A0A0D2PCI9_HYPSF|nr:hypothetical protein HYPSUDRAFT_199019 [Hypholoma sublateritium FD-334 SS-4]
MTDASTSTVAEVPSPTEARIRSTKRKLHDAFEVLDSAVTATAPSERPPPPKRANTIRSLYSTLAKYGIKSGTTPAVRASASLSANTKSTPHLTAILNRAALKTKDAFTFRFSSQSQTPAPPLAPTAEYRPSSLPSFLSRLATYKLTTYANKPPSIDAVAASKCGWINDGKDRLVCGLCNASWVVAGREGMNRDAANSLIEKQRVALVDAHKQGCPWKTRQCQDSIYCVPLQSPAGMIKDIKLKASAMDALTKDISIKHPLTGSQLGSLRDVLSSYSQQTDSSRMNEDYHEAPSTPPPPPASPPSEAAVLISLFGWSLVPPTPPEPPRRASGTRASSVASVPPSPTPSRASSVAPPRTPPKAAQQSTESSVSVRIPSAPSQLKPENAVLQCELCQRRLGLWAFAARAAPPVNEAQAVPPPATTVARATKALPRRAFDLLKEHRSYCPYVVRSTAVPSLPVAAPIPATPGRGTSSNGYGSSLSVSQFTGKAGAPGALEGWRAVLIVVLRYGMAHKQRIEYNFLAPKDPISDVPENGDEMEVDSVKAMVTGVKTGGGKDLLKYVRGLLG